VSKEDELQEFPKSLGTSISVRAVGEEGSLDKTSSGLLPSAAAVSGWAAAVSSAAAVATEGAAGTGDEAVVSATFAEMISLSNWILAFLSAPLPGGK